MVSQTIKWHEEGNNNFREYIDEKKKELQELSEEIGRDEKKWRFKDKEIAIAKERGKESFDAEKFLISKKSKRSK